MLSRRTEERKEEEEEDGGREGTGRECGQREDAVEELRSSRQQDGLKITFSARPVEFVTLKHIFFFFFFFFFNILP